MAFSGDRCACRCVLCCRSFKAEADAWGQQQAQSLAGLTASLSGVRGTFNTWDEGGVHDLNDNCLAPVLDALWSSGRLGEQCRLEKVSGAPARVTGDPDRCIVSPSGKVLVPFELKHRFALPTDMAPLHRLELVDKDKTALQKHVEQLFGFVVGSGELLTKLSLVLPCTDIQDDRLSRNPRLPPHRCP